MATSKPCCQFVSIYITADLLDILKGNDRYKLNEFEYTFDASCKCRR